MTNKLKFYWLMGFLLFAALASCAPGSAPEIITEEKVIGNYMGCPFKVKEVDGCEYLIWQCGNGTWGTHKGNCKNPIHYKK